MTSSTHKLFEQLLSENRSIEVDDLLGYFKDKQSDEYQQLAAAAQNPLDRTKKLKQYVFKCYENKTLRDLEFFKYLAWSGQRDLCTMIGYSDKQIDKWQTNIPQRNAKPHITTVNNGSDEEMDTGENSGVRVCGCMHTCVCVCDVVCVLHILTTLIVAYFCMYSTNYVLNLLAKAFSYCIHTLLVD